jgi:ketosteroid isomerase-like protein
LEGDMLHPACCHGTAALLVVDCTNFQGGRMMAQLNNTATSESGSIEEIDRIYRAWDEALGKKDLDASMALYAPNATLESPLVRHLLGIESGVLDGRDAIRHFVEKVYQRTPPTRQRFRKGYFTDGRTAMWEYPRAAPNGEQMDFVEVMEIEDGLIRHHRVYWGWFGHRVLEKNQYHR